MYKKARYNRSKIRSVETIEGEPIEWKIERIVSNKEPITDGAPSIFTERKDGVVSAYNIRTDRWEIAADAMDLVSKSKQAKREERAEARKAKKEAKVIEISKDKNSGTESTEGTSKAE